MKTAVQQESQAPARPDDTAPPLEAAPQGFDSFKRSSYFASLDGLRALSIFMVIGGHCGYHSRFLGPLFASGFYGVSLFFLLSGFLITTLLLREKEKYGNISLRKFYLRRTLRIFPVYYAALAIYTILIYHSERGTPRGDMFLDDLPAFLTYTANWFVIRGAHFSFAWSLATEEQFYLGWSPVLRYLPLRQVPRILILVTLAAAGLEYAVHRHFIDMGLVVNNMLTTVPSSICFGCLLAFILNSPVGFARARRWLGNTWAAPAALLALMGLYFLTPDSELFITITMAVLLCSVLVNPHHRLSWLLNNPIARYVGKISYGMYLLHMLTIALADRLGVPRDVRFLGFVMLATILLSSLSYYGLESPFLRLKGRYATRTDP